MGFSRNCSSLYDGNSTRMQSPTPVVCKHPRLQDHTSPLQVLQVASGDFLTLGASPLPPLLIAHMKAGAASRGPRQVNNSRNHCRPQTSTPSMCAGEVKPALQTKTALGLHGYCAARLLRWRRVNTKAERLKANVLHQATSQCCTKRCSAPPRYGGTHDCRCHIAVPLPRGLEGSQGQRL